MDRVHQVLACSFFLFPLAHYIARCVVFYFPQGSAFSPVNTPEASGVHNKGKLLWLEAAAMVRGAQLEKEMTADKLVFAEAAAPAVSPTSVRGEEYYACWVLLIIAEKVIDFWVGL